MNSGMEKRNSPKKYVSIQTKHKLRRLLFSIFRMAKIDFVCRKNFYEVFFLGNRNKNSFFFGFSVYKIKCIHFWDVFVEGCFGRKFVTR